MKQDCMPAQRSIVICGGAFAGLALALALRQGLGPDIPVIVADPALGLRKLPRREFEEKWTGYAALFDYTPAFEQAPVSRPVPVGVMPRPGITPPPTGQAAPVQSCGGAYGLRFNLEPRPDALLQNDESVAFLRG